MSRQWQAQRKPLSSSASPPVHKSLFRQRPFSPPVEDTAVQPKQQGTAQRSGFDLTSIRLFPDSPLPIQTKLTVGAPGDKYEQEADNMANTVMSMSSPTVQREMAPEENKEEEVQTKPLASTITPLVQREMAPEEKEEEVQTKPLTASTIQREMASQEDKEEEVQTKLLTGSTIQREMAPQEDKEEEVQTKLLTGSTIQREMAPEEEEEPVQAKSAPEGNSQTSGNIENQLNASTGGGSPLSDEVRSFMEPRFGTNFSSVRVHTNSAAVQMNRELAAQAFTHGSDIYFGAGKSPGNNELMAHELTHVVQQTGWVQ
ncbi:hypothetical protein NUACC21_64900 [Scytonema sp. NUACC21]